MPLTLKDLEKAQAKLGDDYRIELVDGKITVMSPYRFHVMLYWLKIGALAMRQELAQRLGRNESTVRSFQSSEQ